MGTKHAVETGRALSLHNHHNHNTSHQHRTKPLVNNGFNILVKIWCHPLLVYTNLPLQNMPGVWSTYLNGKHVSTTILFTMMSHLMICLVYHYFRTGHYLLHNPAHWKEDDFFSMN